MNEMATNSVLARLQRRNPRYADSAYLFVLAALHSRLSELDAPRHISGEEVANAVRNLALTRFGPLARSVLEHWGIHSTSDMGEVVFALVECGVLTKQPHDSREDFEGLFTFEDAFESSYPWGS